MLPSVESGTVDALRDVTVIHRHEAVLKSVRAVEPFERGSEFNRGRRVGHHHGEKPKPDRLA